jgi:transcriptional regulator with XRE-family HTH domain
MAKKPIGLGVEIKREREFNGWTQFELAMKTGIQPSEISKYEKGVYEPNVPNYFKLCEAFGWPVPEWWKATGTDDSSQNACSTYTLADLQVLWPEGFPREYETLSAV